jgi:hypothetical protein
VELSFLDLDCLYTVAAIPKRRRRRRKVAVVTRTCGSLQRLWCRWHDLLQYLEEVGVLTWSFCSFQGSECM